MDPFDKDPDFERQFANAVCQTECYVKFLKASWGLYPLLAGVCGLTYYARAYSLDAVNVVDMEAWGVFLSVFGMFFAIIVGFVLYEALGRYGKLKNTISAEINAIQDVRDFVLYLDGDQEQTRVHIRRSLKAYASSVAEREWDVMAARDTSFSSDTSDELYDVMRATNKIEVTNESDQVALAAIITHIAQITTHRTCRISLSKERIPDRINILLAFMALVIVSSLILMALPNVVIHFMMVIAVTTSVYLAYKILEDLNEPFSGTWSLKNTGFLRLAEGLTTVVDE
jgi:hypothetical protein